LLERQKGYNREVEMVGPIGEERRRLLTEKSLEAREAGREEAYLILSSLVELGEWRETLEKETEHLLKEIKHLSAAASQLSRRLAELEARVHEESE
jgi:hypothetical protein